MYLSTRSLHLELSIEYIIVHFFNKFPAIIYRIVDIIRLLPIRVKRLLLHILKLVNANERWNELSTLQLRLRTLLEYVVRGMIYFLAIFGIAEIYETLCDFFKFNTRPLEDWEIKLAKTIFKDSIDYSKVRVDNYAFIGPKQYRFAYVGFNTINIWGSMRDSLFLHEMTHIYQYQKFGAIYIYDALKAQHSEKGYDYGGASELKRIILSGKGFADFNLEQQGDIVSDYFLIKNGYAPQWGIGDKMDLEIYEACLSEIGRTDIA